MAENQTPEAALEWRRTEDFQDLYCNNIRFEASTWDLKVLFGTLDQGNPDPASIHPAVKFHTGVTMPWAQAKIALYNLYVTILFHEQSDGAISVPVSVRPPRIGDVLPEYVKEPEGQAMAERLGAFRTLLFGE